MEESSAAPGLSFVKRAVLQSGDGGNSFNVEVEDKTNEQSEILPDERLSLYDQLKKTITERRAQKIEGNPDELSIEDQQFVNRVLEQKDREVAFKEAEVQEFKRQRLMVMTAAAQHKSTIAPQISSASNAVSPTKDATSSADGMVVLVKKKKKKIDAVKAED